MSLFWQNIEEIALFSILLKKAFLAVKAAKTTNQRPHSGLKFNPKPKPARV